ncbi:hypothetical protein ACWDOR_23165 [Streptosporangium canum]
MMVVRDQLTGRPPRQMILKFCKNPDEPAKIRTAYQVAPEAFRDDHLAKPGDPQRLRHWAVIFLEIAGDLSSYRPLEDYTSQSDLAKVCKIITASLLDGWNQSHIDLEKSFSVAEFLTGLLGENRLSRDSALHRFAESAEIGQQDLMVRRPGWERELVNPFALTRSDTRPGAHEFSAIVGRAHGDLSVRNILIPGYPKFAPAGYRLIDYGGYSSTCPLTWDSMYMLVSLSTRWLREVTPRSEKARALIHCLTRHEEKTGHLGLDAYQKVIKAVFQEGHAWANKITYADRWLSQCSLSLVAAALIFIGREIPGHEDEPIDDWLFDLAALATEDYLRRSKLEFTPTDNVVRFEEFQQRKAQQATTATLLSRELEETVINAPNWATLDRVTRELRRVLALNFVIESEHEERIRGLISTLRSQLEQAIDPRLSRDEFSRAVARAELTRVTLLTLLTS